MHRSNTDGNNFEAIYSEETARSGATEFLVETSRLVVKQPEQDSGWKGDIPQLSNDEVEQSGVEQSGLEQSGLEHSGLEGSDQHILIENAVRERKKSGHANDIAESARVESIKANWKVN